MENLLLFIDRLSAGVGKAFGWCIIIMTLGTSYEVFVRYVLRAPTNWAFDLSYFMYGALFMMAGAYTLSRNGHVRGDFVYRMLPFRVQASIDLVLFILFMRPGFRRAVLLRHSLCSSLLADPRGQHLQPDRRAGLSAQDADPDRGVFHAVAMFRRNRSLHHLHSRRRVAATAA